MSKYLHNKVYISLPGTGKKIVRVPVRAKALKRSLSFYRKRQHVEDGVRGECATCANAIGAVDAGLAELAQFTDSRVYLVDKFNKKGVPTECTVGIHEQGEFQKQFDKDKKALLRSDRCEGIVTIRPFHEKRHKNNSPNKPTGPHKGPTAKHRVRERGAVARALRAGIMA